MFPPAPAEIPSLCTIATSYPSIADQLEMEPSFVKSEFERTVRPRPISTWPINLMYIYADKNSIRSCIYEKIEHMDLV